VPGPPVAPLSLEARPITRIAEDAHERDI